MEILPGFFPLLLSLIIILSVIFREGNKRLLWLLVLLSLIMFSYSLRVIGDILIYALPKMTVVKGTNLPSFPAINGIIILLLSFPLIFLCRKNTPPPTKKPSTKRWLWFGLSIVTLLIAQFVFLISIYAPCVLWIDVAKPQIGVFANVIITIIGSFLLYYSSKLNTPTQPNLLRWLAFLFAVIISIFTPSWIMLLIYVVPPKIGAFYPFLVGILSLNLIILSLVAIGIAKDYVPNVKK